MRARQLPLMRLRRPRVPAAAAGDMVHADVLNNFTLSPVAFFTTSSLFFRPWLLLPSQPQKQQQHPTQTLQQLQQLQQQQTPCRRRRHHSTLLPLRSAGRPQLPFLATTTSAASRAVVSPRYFTTQRRRWLQYEALAFVKYTLYFWAAVACVVLGQFVVQQEALERVHPTPPAWTFLSRMRLRGALGEEHEGEGDHVQAIQILLDLLKRLEDPSVDGQGVVRLGDNDVTSPLDISTKDEPWRRGYFEALLAAAAAAEHVDGWVRDRTRNVVVPPDMVVGPANQGRPRRPLPPGSALVGGAPRQEDCDPDPWFPAPAALYTKLLRTRGLTPHQQITAALAFANYLEYKADRDAAAAVYGRAVLVAAKAADAEGAPAFYDKEAVVDDTDPADPAAWIQAWAKSQGNSKSRSRSSAAAAAAAGMPPVSQNLLSTLTAYATFRARTGDVAVALPLFVALLQARQALPPASSEATEAARRLSPATAATTATAAAAPTSMVARIRSLFVPPAYPPPPDDGRGPPLPGPQALCSEAALRLHIGEILYASAAASASGKSNVDREQGIAWTREAVDVAEEQLHELAQAAAERRKQQRKAQALLGSLFVETASSDAAAKATCRECLAAGLDNWATMVAQLARDEARRKGPGSTPSSSSDGSWWPSWLSIWGSGQTTTASPASSSSTTSPHLHRWEAEEKVIQDRRRRARELLEEEQKAPSQGFMKLFKA